MTPCQQEQQPGLIPYEEIIERDEAPDLACRMRQQMTMIYL
jgi:hypothetical protein